METTSFYKREIGKLEKQLYDLPAMRDALENKRSELTAVCSAIDELKQHENELLQEKHKAVEAKDFKTSKKLVKDRHAVISQINEQNKMRGALESDIARMDAELTAATKENADTEFALAKQKFNLCVCRANDVGKALAELYKELFFTERAYYTMARDRHVEMNRLPYMHSCRTEGSLEMIPNLSNSLTGDSPISEKYHWHLSAFKTELNK